MQKDDQELTLQDVMNHISASKQSLKKEIEVATAKLEKKIDRNANKIEQNAAKIDQLHLKIDVLGEDVRANGREIYSSKHIFQPHTKTRLDRLEDRATLAPITEPVPVE